MNRLLTALSKGCKQSSYPTRRQTGEEAYAYRVRAAGITCLPSLYTLRSDRIRKGKERTTAAQERFLGADPWFRAPRTSSGILGSRWVALFCVVLVGQINSWRSVLTSGNIGAAKLSTLEESATLSFLPRRMFRKGWPELIASA